MNEPRRQARLFLGVKISMAAVSSLSEIAEAQRRRARDLDLRIRWMAPASYHITLKFLGWTRHEAVTAIRDVLDRSLAGLGSFEIAGRGLGAFPSPEQARVLWAGIDDPAGGLTRLAEVVDRELGELGFPREKRPFHPHITLGRVKQPSDLTGLLRMESERMFRQTRVDAVTLYESIMKTQGSEYLARARFSLEAAPQHGRRQTGPLKPVTDTGLDEQAGGLVVPAEPVERRSSPLVSADPLSSEAPIPEAEDQGPGHDGQS